MMQSSRNEISNFHDDPNNSLKQHLNIYPETRSYKYNVQRPDEFHQYQGQVRLSYDNPNSSMKRSSFAKIGQFRKQVHEVIDLCKIENVDVKGQLNNVAQAQRNIYNLLLENPQSLKRIASHQSIIQNPSSNIQSNLIRKQEHTPIMQKNQGYIPQSIYYIPNFSQVGVKEPNIVSNQQIKKNQSAYVKNQFNVDPNARGGGLQNSFNLLKNADQVLINDDALRLIQQIERKAFEQIERLRKEKIQLMQKLNQQIKNVNEQRRRNNELQDQIITLRNQYQRPDGTYLQGENIQYLHSKINRLQGELKRSNQINNYLNNEQQKRGSGLPGIQQLLRQGELIRQDTLRLLKIKQSNKYRDERVRQLERLLEQQKNEKYQALDQIKNIKSRIGGTGIIASQSKISQTQSGYGKSVVQIQSPRADRSSNQYQDLLSQMKRITGY